MSPIDCEKVLKEIELFLDGELEDSVSGAVRLHLSACGPCMDHSEFQRRLRELFATKCHSEAPEYLQAQVEGLLKDPGQA